MEAKIIELLLHFGLTRQEAKIYILLLREGPLSGYEAAKRTGISRSNAYGALAALVEKGAAYILEEQAVQYQAVSIEEFCDNNLHFLTEVAKELKASMPAQKKRNENYVTIRGQRNVEDKCRNMLLQVESRVYLSVTSEILDRFKKELKILVDAGKKVVLITNTTYDLEGAILYQTPREDTQIRLITDSRYALTGEMSDEWQTTCLYSENPNLVKLLKEALTNEIKLISLGE
ncbi:MAG: helix-turn-helix domain-containing protein [Eubacteriales bacterium]|nr:helix-turn-helix domain-containing protein [Eubacteriales bacterium]